MTAPDLVPFTFIDANGGTHELEARAGRSVMLALQDAGVIEGECGGSLACATCHVWVDAAFAETFGEPSEGEEDMLDVAFNVSATSRLSCQLPLSAAVAGLVIRAPTANDLP